MTKKISDPNSKPRKPNAASKRRATRKEVMKLPGEDRVSPKRVKLMEDWRVIFQMRIAGFTIPDIANELGVSTAAVRDKISQALQYFVAEPVEEARQMELTRLDGLLAIAWEAATQGGSAKAFDKVLDIMKQRAELMGLYAPRTHRIQAVIPDVDVEGVRTKRWEQIKESPIGRLLTGVDDGFFSDPYEQVSEVEDAQQGRERVAAVAGADGGGPTPAGGPDPAEPDHADDEAEGGSAEAEGGGTGPEGGAGGEEAPRGDAGKQFGKQVRFPTPDQEGRKTRLPARYFRGKMSGDTDKEKD